MSAVIYRIALSEATARVEAMFWIPSLTCGEGHPREFREFCEDLPERRDHPLYQAIPALLTSLDEDDFDPEMVAEDLLQSGVGGFLIQAATPCFSPYGDGRSHSYSWGHYYTEWLHAPDERSIAKVVTAWAEGRHKTDLERRSETQAASP